MANPVKRALADYFRGDASDRRQRSKPAVGLAVTEARPRFCVGLTLTYRSGNRYCCTSPACMFAPDWPRLRRLLREHGVETGQPLRILLRCVYETGARFAVHPADSTTEYQAIADSRSSSHIVDEEDGWDPAY